jgi:hypothetical protein
VSKGGDYFDKFKRSFAASPSRNGDSPSGPNEKPQGDERAVEPWVEPVPFNTLANVPPFPTERLPSWLGEWVQGESEATQTPPDLAGNLVLPLAGAAVARKVRVYVCEGWTEPANIFTVTSLPPGDRKTIVFDDATAPLLAYEVSERKRMEPIIAEAASEHRVMEARLKHLELKVAKANSSAEVARLKHEAKQLAKELAEHRVPLSPQSICDDETPENLARLLAHHGGRMLQASDEGTAFEIAKGRYSEKANFDVYLKGHAGSELRVGRVSRVAESVSKPALSCALAVQPDVIHGLVEQASMRGRGFLARWLYSVPVSLVGGRKPAPRPVPKTVSQRYHKSMTWLWELPRSAVPGQEAGRAVEFSRQALEGMRELQAWLEPQLAEGEPLAHLGGWANKLCGAVARISLILHMAQTLGAGQPWIDPISRETFEAAAVLGRDYYLPHARAAFGLMGADDRAKDAARVVGWLATLDLGTLKPWKRVPVVTKGEIHGKVFGGSRSIEEVSATCRLLCDHGYLRAAGSSWRRDVQAYELNPHLKDGAEEG